MPQRQKGARLWLKPSERGRDAVWLIKDGGRRISTGCVAHDLAGAERALAVHLASKAARDAAGRRRQDPGSVSVAEVLMVYWEARKPKAPRPAELKAQILRLNDFFGSYAIADVSRALCDEYVAKRGAQRAAGVELAYLKAAINHATKERIINYAVPVSVPRQNTGRERWLTRDELAKLLKACWRYSREYHGQRVYMRQHLALFVLIGRYTGTRSGAVLSATWKPEKGYGWIDLDAGVFHRGAGAAITNKRKPTVRLPPPLLAHLRRWRRNRPADRFVIEWGGKPVTSIKRSWRSACDDAKLGDDVTPHTLRHTCATHLMQGGADKWEAAGFLGMTVKMLDDTYGHHHPAHQEGAHKALGVKRSANRSAKPTLKVLSGGAG